MSTQPSVAVIYDHAQISEPAVIALAKIFSTISNCPVLSPVEFSEQILGLKLWTSQSLISKLVYGLELNEEERRLLQIWEKGDPEFGGEVTYHPGETCRELALVCGVRSSKTFMAAFFAAYESYKFLMMPDPYGHYGIIKNSPVFGIIAATSKETATDTVFAQLKPMLQNPFFEGHGLELKKREAVFPNHNYTIRAGASTSAALVGRTTLFAILDELDFLPDTKGRLGGKAVYQAISKGTTTLNGLNISLTSPLWRDSQSANLLSLAGVVKNMVAIRQPTWLINPSPNESRYSPKIIAEFQKDPDGAARDYGAKHSLAITPFFRDSTLIERCCILENGMDEEGRLMPFEFDPYATYCAAGDPAPKHDRFGIALGHRGRDGNIVIDIAYGIKPDPDAGVAGEVDPHDVKTLYLSFLNKAQIEACVFDTYLYMEVRHELFNRGVDVQQHHVNLSDYQIMKDYIYTAASEGTKLLTMPNNPLLISELLSLERNKKRIDHPPKGSKDVADAVCQVVSYLDKIDPISTPGDVPEVVY